MHGKKSGIERKGETEEGEEENQRINGLLIHDSLLPPFLPLVSL